MSPQDFFYGLVRHVGYALVCGMGLMIVVERIIPGFSTPYFNPYLYLGVGMCLAIVGSQPSKKIVLGRSLLACGLISVLGFFFITQYSFENRGIFGLMMAGLVLLVGFGFASIYSDEL